MILDFIKDIAVDIIDNIDIQALNNKVNHAN